MDQEPQSPSTALTQPAPGLVIRGRVFLLPFLVLLVLLLAFTLAIAFQFQSIMSQLDEARSVWPAASAELNVRYAEIAKQLVTADPNSTNPMTSNRWETGYQAFRETTQYDRQLPHAMQLEELIVQQSLAPSMPMTPAIERWLESERRRTAAQQSAIGRLTISALRLKLPETFNQGR